MRTDAENRLHGIGFAVHWYGVYCMVVSMWSMRTQIKIIATACAGTLLFIAVSFLAKPSFSDVNAAYTPNGLVTANSNAS